MDLRQLKQESKTKIERWFVSCTSLTAAIAICTLLTCFCHAPASATDLEPKNQPVSEDLAFSCESVIVGKFVDYKSGTVGPDAETDSNELKPSLIVFEVIEVLKGPTQTKHL
jgi:hypothetical protein